MLKLAPKDCPVKCRIGALRTVLQPLARAVPFRSITVSTDANLILAHTMREIASEAGVASAPQMPPGRIRQYSSGRVVGQSENGHRPRRRSVITPVKSLARQVDGKRHPIKVPLRVPMKCG